MPNVLNVNKKETNRNVGQTANSCISTLTLQVRKLNEIHFDAHNSNQKETLKMFFLFTRLRFLPQCDISEHCQSSLDWVLSFSFPTNAHFPATKTRIWHVFIASPSSSPSVWLLLLNSAHFYVFLFGVESQLSCNKSFFHRFHWMVFWKLRCKGSNAA